MKLECNKIADTEPNNEDEICGFKRAVVVDK